MDHTRSTAGLRAIAQYQKVLILCLLVQLLAWVGFILLNLTGENAAERLPLRVMGGLTVFLGLFGGVFVLLLGMKVSGPTLGVILGILTVIPCLGLIVILVMSLLATSTLKAAGVRVGLFGARMSDIRDRLDDEYDADDAGDAEERPRRRGRRRASDINEDEGWRAGGRKSPGGSTTRSRTAHGSPGIQPSVPFSFTSALPA